MTSTATQRKLLATREAAEHLGLSFRTINNSRYTGLLLGVKAPPYLKMGRSVRYEQHTLDSWTAQFQEQANTSEGAA